MERLTGVIDADFTWPGVANGSNRAFLHVDDPEQGEVLTKCALCSGDSLPICHPAQSAAEML